MDIQDIIRAVLSGAGSAQAGRMPTQNSIPMGTENSGDVPQVPTPDQVLGEETPTPQAGNNPMGDILSSVLGGAQPPAQGQGGANPMGDILSSILGGGAQQQPPSRGGAGSDNPMGDILSSILGGGAQPQPMPRGSAGSDNPMGDILGSILGGGMGGGASQQPMPSGGDPLSSILGAILGGGLGGATEPPQPAPRGRGRAQPAQSGGLGDVLGAVLGGGASPMNNSFLAPIANLIAEKFGISPAIAQIIVSFAISKLFAAQASGGAHGRLAVEDMMGHMNSDSGVPLSYLRKTGMVKELAQNTGIDEKTASRALQEVFNQMGTQVNELGSSEGGSEAPRAAADSGSGEVLGRLSG